MATCNGNGAASFCSKLQVEAIQTVIPMKPTDPRLPRQIAVAENLSSDDLQRRFHVVLYYNKASETDSGWIVAGWIKESLGRALVESPILAGRVRKLEDGTKNLELVPNDSGIRLIEAKIPMNMADFVDPKNKENVETQLVFWEDIHETSPQFSPLLYVQVTNFKCGGYSIGITCSLFLADPFIMTSFLYKWSKIHNHLVTETDKSIPTFYSPNLRKIGCSPTLPNGSITRNQTTTLIFKIPKNPLNLNNDFIKNLAAKCVGEAEDKLCKKLSTKLSLFVKEITSENAKVENCSRDEIVDKACGLSISGLISAKWDDLGIDNVSFNKENKTVHYSCWINAENQDLVMITPSPDEDSSVLNIIITAAN